MAAGRHRARPPPSRLAPFLHRVGTRDPTSRRAQHHPAGRRTDQHARLDVTPIASPPGSASNRLPITVRPGSPASPASPSPELPGEFVLDTDRGCNRPEADCQIGAHSYFETSPRGCGRQDPRPSRPRSEPARDESPPLIRAVKILARDGRIPNRCAGSSPSRSPYPCPGSTASRAVLLVVGLVLLAVYRPVLHEAWDSSQHNYEEYRRNGKA